MGAARPQTPRRSPRQAFGGNFTEACLRQAGEKQNLLRKNLNDYMPVIRGKTSVKKDTPPITRMGTDENMAFGL
jgi:hypothetical protein